VPRRMNEIARRQAHPDALTARARAGGAQLRWRRAAMDVHQRTGTTVPSQRIEGTCALQPAVRRDRRGKRWTKRGSPEIEARDNACPTSTTACTLRAR
jgi:hypothetical protein